MTHKRLVIANGYRSPKLDYSNFARIKKATYTVVCPDGYSADFDRFLLTNARVVYQTNLAFMDGIPFQVFDLKSVPTGMQSGNTGGNLIHFFDVEEIYEGRGATKNDVYISGINMMDGFDTWIHREGIPWDFPLYGSE